MIMLFIKMIQSLKYRRMWEAGADEHQVWMISILANFSEWVWGTKPHPHRPHL